MRMKYEMLLRRAFDCSRFGDPFCLANADVYDNGIIQISHRLKFGISAALKKVANDSDPDNLPLKEELDNLDDFLWNTPSLTQQNINGIIIDALSLFNQHQIGQN